MKRITKSLFVLMLSCAMSFSIVANSLPIMADEVEETTQENDTNTTETVVEDEPEVVEDTTEASLDEVLGDSSMMEYFLVDSPVVSSQETENFVLSLNNTEGYSNFRITIQKEDGTTFDLESSEQVGNLVKFSNVFSNKGEYQVTSLHYEYNGQTYYLNFSDLEMDIKFGVDQEYVGYDETLPDLTQDSQEQEGVIQVTDVNKAEEEIANGMASEASIMSIDEFSRAATGGMTICLDPGHGGSDSGANAFGQKESALTLKIANYCKEELEKYDVNVVMTRTTDTRPSENAAQDLIDRVMMAKKAGASYIISIHLNSAASTSAHGAEVYFPNTSGNASLSSNGQAMAKAIQSQLVALGLYDRGIKIRNYMDGSTSSNPNSSDRDYYGIIRYAKEQNISGLIIEHCFLNNPDEYNKYLSSDAKLQQLGVADAKGIVSALGLSLKNAYLDQIAGENKNLIPDGKYVISSVLNSKYVLNVKNASTNNNANVELSIYDNETDKQAFIVSHDAQGYITFTNAKSGKVLDVSDGKASNGKNVQQYTSNGTRAQKWVVKKSNKGYMIISALDSNYVLDVSGSKANNGTNIQLYSGNGSDAQNWNIEKFVSKYEQLDVLANSNKNTIADGTYEISTKLNTGYVLDMTSSSLSNGGNVQIYESNETPAQGWIVSHDSKGYVTIKNENSGKVMEIKDNKATNLQNVQQNAANDNYGQKWIAIKNSDGSIELVSGENQNYCLDLYSSRTVNGNNVDIYERNNSNAQRWVFRNKLNYRESLDQLANENKNVLANGTYTIASKMNTNYVLDMASSSLSNGGNVQLYISNDTPAQGWIVSHDSKGYVIIKNENSGKVMEVKDRVAKNSQNVQQNQSNDSYGQRWIATKNSDGSIVLVSALNKEYCLNLNGAQVASGSNINIYNTNNSNAQKWVFEKKVSQREALDALADHNKNAISDGKYVIASKINDNYVLDMASSTLSNGGNVQLYEANGTKAQSFIVSHDKNGYVTITNENSNKVIEVNSNSAANMANIQQNQSNDSYRQKWIAIKNSDGSIELVSALNKNYCIDLYSSRIVNGNNVDLYQRNSSNAQKWLFKTKNNQSQVPTNYDAIAAQNKDAIADGKYEIATKLNTSFVLDMTSSSLSNGGNVQLYASNGTKAQGWIVSHDSKGYVTITNENSGKVMEVAGNKVGNLVNVQQNQANSNMGQKWIAMKKADGFIELVSALNTNYCLDLYSSKTVSGNNVEIYEKNGSNAQLWKFQKFETAQEKADRLAKENQSLMNDGVYFIKSIHTEYVLDVPSSSKNPGVNIQLYTLNETDAQKWVLQHDSNGYVTIMNYGSKLYLTASNGRVTQENKSNATNQKWIIMFDAQGRLKIVSATDIKLAIDVASSNFSNGGRIQMYSSNSTGAQQWVFTYIKKYETEKELTPIMGKSLCTVDQLIKYYNYNASGYDTFNAKYKNEYDGCLAKGGASTIEEFAKIFYEEANAEGVRAEIAFAQCMKETGFLKYGGDVLPNQYNYAGIGATGAVHGAEFKDVRTGIRAQIQHLKAYASNSKLVNDCVDPRFNLVKRNSAEYVEWLGIQENPNGLGWASAKNYGYSIVKMVNVLLSK